MNTTTSCLHNFRATYPEQAIPIKPRAISESASNDDYESLGFAGFGNKNQTQENREQWVKDTKQLAWYSIISHGFELPLKLVSVFLFNSENNSFTSKVFFGLERLAGTLGGMFQAKIYSHKDLNGNYDDNLGAELHASKAPEEGGLGDTKTSWLSILNNSIQTKWRFMIPVLSLFNTRLASDVDNGIFEMIKSSWQRTSSFNSGFYPGIVQDLLKKCSNCFSKEKNTTEGNRLPTWGLIKQQFVNHLEKVKEANVEYFSAKQESKNTSLLKWCKYMDQATSVVVPFVSLPSNLLGDTLRPLIRRLDITGPFRTMIKTLSVADRALVGANYWFRHYLPTKITEEEVGIKGIIKPSNLYLFSLVGDILNLPLTIFEDRIQKSSKLLYNLVEIFRSMTNSSFDMFWSAMRIVKAKAVSEGKNNTPATQPINLN